MRGVGINAFEMYVHFWITEDRLILLIDLLHQELLPSIDTGESYRIDGSVVKRLQIQNSRCKE